MKQFYCHHEACPKEAYPTIGDLLIHWLKDCLFVELRCTNCKQLTLRGDLPNKHDCIIALATRNAQLRIKERGLKKKEEDLADETEENGHRQRCYLGHVIKKFDEPKPNRINKWT